MCRLSMLIAKDGYSLTQQSIESQLNHEKRMALGINSIPFKYGHFTGDSDNYNLNEKLIHKDSFGYYFHNSNTEIIQKYLGAAYSVDKKNVTSNILSSTDISFMVARLATLGGKEISNAHPFNLDHIVGSHNGTVSGLEQGEKSDSIYIMNVINQYFSGNSSEVDAESLEQTFIENIVNPSHGYSAMNLIVYVKSLDKVIVLCSYNKNKVKSAQYEQYYTMMIASNKSNVYISSEDDFGEVISNGSNKIYTRNHTLYVIDKKTGEIKEYYLSNLEKAIDRKSKESENRVSESAKERIANNKLYAIDEETGELIEYLSFDLEEETETNEESSTEDIEEDTGEEDTGEDEQESDVDSPEPSFAGVG